MKIDIENKISKLTKELKYYRTVYPRSNKVNKLRCKIYYYNKKLASIA